MSNLQKNPINTILEQGDIPTGIEPRQVWRHKKTGKCYTVLLVSRHTETEEFLVSYSRDGKEIWTRPQTMFLDGRFEYVGRIKFT